LSDRTRSQSAVDAPTKRARSAPLYLRRVGGRLCEALDLVILGAAFLGVALSPSFDAGRIGLAGIRQLPLSLQDLIIVVMCVCTWRMILVSVGLYDSERMHSIWEYELRFLIGLNCCTAVVGLVELVVRKSVDVWHFVAVYWAICFAGMVATRAVLLLLRRARPSRISPVNQR
jgi:hypothetical protein